MEKPEPKRESGIVEVRGGDESDKTETLEHFESKFSEQEVKKLEREKTKEELELLEQINKKIKEFVERYGGAYLEIRPENIHILDYSHLKQFTCLGHYDPAKQEIILAVSSGVSRLQMANLFVHEIMHFQSFQSVIFENLEGNIKHRRVGVDVGIYDDKKMIDSLFRDLNEAITEELVKRFDWDFFESIEYTKEDAEKRNSIIKSKGYEEIAFYESKQSKDGQWEVNLGTRHYERERKYLKNIVDTIFDQNSDKFENKEQVFELFARAAMNGDLKPITALIEQTLGSGSFKRIGQETRYEKS